MDLSAIRRIGVAAARNGAAVLMRHFGKITEINKKGAIDLVTAADIQSETAIIDTIKSRFPDHVIIAEESGETAGSQDVVWYIDPLDGTTNFAHQIGHFAVSIACLIQQRPAVGVVLNPIGGELFTAVDGGGAFFNNRPISVSTVSSLTDSLLVTGFPYNLHEYMDELMRTFADCLQAVQGIRRLGSAALDLCYVACGRFDGFWEQHLKPWDTLAGVLIAREAGGRVTDFSGLEYNRTHAEILASNGLIHPDMVALMHAGDAGGKV